MNKPQWITFSAGALLVVLLFVFGKTTDPGQLTKSTVDAHAGHDHAPGEMHTIPTDTLLTIAKKQLTPAQQFRLAGIENSIARNEGSEQQLHVYHQLANFWRDSANMFIPYAWYTAEAARLENSEKSLTFAAHLLLGRLQTDGEPAITAWEATQAKDLFERALKLNPGNDSSKVGLGACLIFGGISDRPMEGLAHIQEVVKRDSTNVYALVTMARGGVLSGQMDKAIGRLETVHRVAPDNLEAVFLMAEIYERTNKKAEAVQWYNKALPLISNPRMKEEVTKRINSLK